MLGMTRSTLLHLRFPFSFFLLPIFLFGTFHSGEVNTTRFWILFFVLHLLVYPASNGFNSFYDRDEGSIGGLKDPPKVHPDLLLWANILDSLALIISAMVSLWVLLGVLLYILVSRAYSYPGIKLKKYPWIGLLSVAIFQGYIVFILSVMGMKDIGFFELEPMDHFAGLVSTSFLFGSYPMTQIYQHEEDKRGGVMTISRLLGIRGTFLFTGVFFAITMALFLWYFSRIDHLSFFFLQLLCLTPVFLFFLYWQFEFLFLKKEPGFKRTMQLNLISSLCLNLFFLWISLS